MLLFSIISNALLITAEIPQMVSLQVLFNFRADCVALQRCWSCLCYINRVILTGGRYTDPQCCWECISPDKPKYLYVERVLKNIIKTHGMPVSAATLSVVLLVITCLGEKCTFLLWKLGNQLRKKKKIAKLLSEKVSTEVCVFSFLVFAGKSCIVSFNHVV